MKEIDELIQTSEKYKDVLVQKRFDSKKHTVCYVIYNGKPRVLKWYAPGFRHNMETEYKLLKQASSQSTMPSIFEKDSEYNVLIMGYIPGQNLGDVLDDAHIGNQEKNSIIRLLAQWLIQFHQRFKSETGFYIRGDATVRNFLYTDIIWGIDFEEARTAEPGEDIAGLCASILTLDPMFTREKFVLCTTFVDEYQKSAEWKLQNINDDIAYALLEKSLWRPEQATILRNYAQHIRKKGL